MCRNFNLRGKIPPDPVLRYIFVRHKHHRKRSTCVQRKHSLYEDACAAKFTVFHKSYQPLFTPPTEPVIRFRIMTNGHELFVFNVYMSKIVPLPCHFRCPQSNLAMDGITVHSNDGQVTGYRKFNH